MEAARHFIFETYCRIHHKIDIGMLAEKMVGVFASMCVVLCCVVAPGKKGGMYIELN